jgi:hypothetical protein
MTGPTPWRGFAFLFALLVASVAAPAPARAADFPPTVREPAARWLYITNVANEGLRFRREAETADKSKRQVLKQRTLDNLNRAVLLLSLWAIQVYDTPNERRRPNYVRVLFYGGMFRDLAERYDDASMWYGRAAEAAAQLQGRPATMPLFEGRRIDLILRERLPQLQTDQPKRARLTVRF